jgi:CHAD domain-containing protein
LRHRAGEGWTLKLAPAHDGGFLVRDERSFPGDPKKIPPEALDLLSAYARGSELGPVARLHTVRRRTALRTEAGEQVGELVDDEVSVMEGRRVAARFREVELELAGGLPGGLVDALVTRLRDVGAGPTANVPKYLQALGARADRPPEVAVADVGPHPGTAEVIGASLAGSVVRLMRHDAGVRLGEDPEDIHAARVATRRLRSDLRTFRSVLEPEWSATLRSELSWLGGELGAVRDADVLLARLRKRVEELSASDADGATALLQRLENQRGTARERLLCSMRDPRYLSLLDRLVQAANAPVVAGDADAPASAALAGLMDGPWGHLRAAATADEPNDAALHMVRIRTKRARYAAEALAPVFERSAGGFVRAATELQDLLGEHQDAVVAQVWLRDAAAAAGSRSTFVAGILVEQERRAQAAALAAWPKAWKQLARKRLRFWR